MRSTDSHHHPSSVWRILPVLLLVMLTLQTPLVTSTAITGSGNNDITTGTSTGISATTADLNATDANVEREQQQQRHRQQHTVSALLQATGDVRFVPALLAATALIVGLGMVSAGYRLFRASVFVIAFVAGGLATARAVEDVFRNESYLVAASWIAFIGAGLVVACVAASLYYVGIFVVGAAAGLLLAVALNAGVGQLIYPSNPGAVLLALAIVLGVAGGMTAVCLEKPALIAVASFVGAALVVWGVGYFAGHFPSGDALRSVRAESRKGGVSWIAAIPGAWWGYLATLVMLTVVGVVVQRKLTARDGYYDAQVGFVKDSATFARSRDGVLHGSGGTLSGVRSRLSDSLASHFRRSTRGGGESTSGTRAYGYGHARTPSRTTRAQRPRSVGSRRRRYESDFIV